MNSNPYTVHQLDPSCWRIEENGVRAFLVTGSKKALLIDSGFGTGDIKALAETLTSLPLTLINTHADRDHIGCNGLFERAYMHPAEFDRYHRGAGAGLKAEPLWEGDIIDIGGRALEVILIPGHTPGSIALLDTENRIIFCGDSLQTGLIYMFGPGRDIHAYIESMKKLSGMSDRFDKIYPSHGDIPIGPAIIGDTITGAKRLLNGEVEGTKPDRPDITAMLYDTGAARFLYE